MYTLLLVDDEPRQLRALSSIIRQLRPDYAVATASDGSEALALLQSENSTVDAVITDIRMPVMDGLQLLEQMNRIQCRAKVALLSGYGEFEYAQQAIRMGIFDYLVKPIGKTDIEKLLDKLDKELEQERSQSRQLGELVRQLDDSLPAYRAKLLGKWLHGHADSTELKQRVQADLNADWGFIFSAKFGKTKEQPRAPDLQASDRFHAELKLKLDAIAPAYILTWEEREGLFTTLVICKEPIAPHWRRLVDQLRQTAGDIGTEYGIVVSVGVGLPSDRIWPDGVAAYRQASEALGGCFFEGAGRVLVYERHETSKTAAIDIMEGEDLLAESVGCCQAEAIHEWLNVLFEKIGGNRRLQPEQVKSDVIRLVLNRLRDAKHLTSDAQFQAMADEIRGKLSACEDYRELRHWTKKMLIPIVDLYRLSNLDKNGLVLHKCKEYIKERCHSELTLESLAQMFHFNPSYFSTYFKTHTGMSLTDYIVSVRMDLAQQLLLQTDAKISDVARKVGYKDAGYFIRVFRKEKGISPKKYRSLNGKGI